MDAAAELLKLAKEKFSELTEAEKKLFRNTANGKIADYSAKDPKDNNPAKADGWGDERVLLADRIAWLCTNKQALQSVTHRGFQIKGARIDEQFDLMFAKVPFPLYFERCKFMSHINLQYVQIAALNMSGTHTGPISADGLKVNGPVYLGDGFKAEGEVRLFGATIGGSLDCGNGRFINGSKETFVADGLDVRGSVFMNKGFKAEGQVSLFGATIGVNLDCMKGQFTNESKSALNADELKVSGGVYLSNGFRAEGIVSFVGATIDGYFSLRHVDSPGQMKLDLDTAKIGTLHDKEDGWPAPEHLVLNGLEYKEISHESPRDPKARIKWLRLQQGFWPQPYEHLAKVLRESGEGADARDVLVAKNKDKAKRSKTKLTFTEKCWYRFFGPLIGYGHKPWLAIPLALVLILFGSVFFKKGYSHGLMTPPTESAYTEDKSGIPDPGDAGRRISETHPVFNSLVYSIDVFVPLVDLHQVKYWLPNANRIYEPGQPALTPLYNGGVLLAWLWIETACGWVLMTLFLVGLTSLVRT